VVCPEVPSAVRSDLRRRVLVLSDGFWLRDATTVRKHNAKVARDKSRHGSLLNSFTEVLYLKVLFEHRCLHI